MKYSWSAVSKAVDASGRLINAIREFGIENKVGGHFLDWCANPGRGAFKEALGVLVERYRQTSTTNVDYSVSAAECLKGEYPLQHSQAISMAIEFPTQEKGQKNLVIHTWDVGAISYGMNGRLPLNRKNIVRHIYASGYRPADPVEFATFLSKHTGRGSFLCVDYESSTGETLLIERDDKKITLVGVARLSDQVLNLHSKFVIVMNQ